MFGTKRCDEIIRIIDEVLAATGAPPAAERGSAAGRPAVRAARADRSVDLDA